MRVLLAGASGALGIALTCLLLAAGHEVIALSQTSANRDKLLMLAAYRDIGGCTGGEDG